VNLDNVTVALRPRGEWEAADLGVRMVRRDAGTIYRTWFALTLPFAIIALLVTAFTPYAALALFVYWWFEPVTDGPILHVISRRLFGEQTGWKTALRETPRLAARNRLFLLTPWRLHFARSVAVPVTQLEGLAGEARKSRARLLNRRIFNYGVGITVAYQHLLLCVYFGIMLMAVVLVPPAFQDTLGNDWFRLFFLDGNRAGSVIGFILVYAAQSALHPWFVGAGFGLYINCRTRLEAWDIEVAFRRMLQRRSGQLAAAAVVVLALCLPPAVTPSHAQDDDAAAADEVADGPVSIIGYWEDEEFASAIETVMTSDALSTSRDVRRWVRKDRDETGDEETARGDGRLSALLDAIGAALSVVFEFALWIAAAAILLLLALTARYWLPLLGVERRRRYSPERVVLADGEISHDTLPDDIPAAARQLWERGERRRAMSLLFRGSVFAAVVDHGVRLPDSATEGDCLGAVRRQAGGGYADYFGRVVHAWVRCAYGAKAPDDELFGALCTDWQSHAGSAS